MGREVTSSEKRLIELRLAETKMRELEQKIEYCLQSCRFIFDCRDKGISCTDQVLRENFPPIFNPKDYTVRVS